MTQNQNIITNQISLYNKIILYQNIEFFKIKKEYLTIPQP